MKMNEGDAKKNSLKSIIKKMRAMEAAGLKDMPVGKKDIGSIGKGKVLAESDESIEPDYEDEALGEPLSAMEKGEAGDGIDEFEEHKRSFMNPGRQKIGESSKGMVLAIEVSGPKQQISIPDEKRGRGRPRKI